MAKRQIRQLTAGAVCGIFVLAIAIFWLDQNRRTEPIRPGTHAGEQWIGNSLNIPMRWCPPGTFMMGSPVSEAERGDDEDQVSVTLAHGFWMGQTEVTQGQWRSVMGTTPWSSEAYTNRGPNFPAVCVSHSGKVDSAAEFCERFTVSERAAGRLPKNWVYRLPTEAEWEYACRAGSTTAFGFGNDSTKLTRYAWVADNSVSSPMRNTSWLNDPLLYAHPVAKKSANSWGMQDMHGNVWEWCADAYEEAALGGIDPENKSPFPNNVFRGGCWNDSPDACRSARRSQFSTSFRSNGLGFRIALGPSHR